MPVKLTTITKGKKRGQTQRKKKTNRIYRTSQNIKIITFFLIHCCQRPFLRWESQSTSFPQDVLQHCAGLWPFHGSSSDYNLVLHLCVLASQVHSYQSQCFLLWELSLSFYIFQRLRVCLVYHVDLMCSLYSCGKLFGLLSQPHCPWVSIMVLFPPLHVHCSLRFAPEAALEDLGLPL